MRKEEYIKTVSEQIRSQMARDMVEKELSDHIDDQAESYEKEGMSEEEAFSRAVLDMGDPVETGIELDRIHRPEMEWKLILLTACVSMLGLFIQYLLVRQMSGETENFSAFSQHCISVLAGFGCMIAVCYADYSRIGKHAKLIALVLLALMLCTGTMGMEINGRRQYWKLILGFHLDVFPCMFLLVPLFGGILYSYKGEGVKGFLKSMVWMLVPVLISVQMSSLSTALVLYASMLIMITTALLKGWFVGHGKRTAVFLWGASILLPAVSLISLLVKDSGYRSARIRAWLEVGYDRNGAGYLISMVREFLGSAKWLGAGRASGDIQMLSGAGSDFILTYLITYYGILAGVGMVSFLGILLIRCLKVSLRQKNQLGMMMGLGCSLVFLTQSVLYILVNLTILPYTRGYLPLFSLGGTAAVVSFLLLGMILSIYRHQNLLPSEPAKSYIHVKL